MKYCSTRGKEKGLSFKDVLFSGMYIVIIFILNLEDVTHVPEWNNGSLTYNYILFVCIYYCYILFICFRIFSYIYILSIIIFYKTLIRSTIYVQHYYYQSFYHLYFSFFVTHTWISDCLAKAFIKMWLLSINFVIMTDL